MGSSPRMRGAPRFYAEANGLTRDHPRGCGEHNTPNSQSVVLPGSSPRMRGARRWCHDRTQQEGIIPADAGSTGQRTLAKWIPKDHPRGCGEHMAPGTDNQCRLGSSPRMRGAHCSSLIQPGNSRIIPADAGSTHLWLLGPVLFVDHPRGCGEHST